MAIALVLALALALAVQVAYASAEGPEGGVAWRLEQPRPPKSPPGVQESPAPIGLGKIGDIEFWAPNRGLLSTAGNPPTIPPGLWAYNGSEWHELATVCGATDGRIAWAGPDELWTVSDGRPGQVEAGSGGIPPLEDNTLCHFAGGQVVASYAHPAFQADSYREMHAAGCITATDCWFAGDPLPEPQIGAFHLHWNGSSLETEPYPAEGHAVEDMRLFEEHLYESVRISPEDRVAEEQLEAPVVHRINPEGVQPTFKPERGLPLSGGEGSNVLDFLHLGAADGALWGAAGGGQVTVVRRAAGKWSQLLGPATHPSGAVLFPNEAVEAIAAEPGTDSAWLGLDSPSDAQRPNPTASALVASISAEGKVSEAQTLPSGGVGGRGAAAKIACPAPHDCWLATTQGWLFHLAPAGERSLPLDTDPAFAGLITYRPPDQGLPQVPPDAPPPDNSGLVEGPPPYGGLLAVAPKSASESRVALPLLSHLHSRLVGRTTLELRFHLAVKARIRLIAKRRRRVVAATPMRTLAAGSRRLLLRLDPRRWPTKLDMQTHPLAPLPTAPAHGEGAGTTIVSTGLAVLPRVGGIPFSGGSELLP
ncbi:MAG: hypothetical protein ACHQE6_06250 [Solirubrobacterales bacterium]